MKKGRKYEKDFPKLLYSAFLAMINDSVTPSFSKFARSIGVTVADLERWRKNKEFDRAWRECIEIRRDYLTDSALTRRYDPSFVKFLLSEDSMQNEERNAEENSLCVSIKVID